MYIPYYLLERHVEYVGPRLLLSPATAMVIDRRVGRHLRRVHHKEVVSVGALRMLVHRVRRQRLVHRHGAQRLVCVGPCGSSVSVGHRQIRMVSKREDERSERAGLATVDVRCMAINRPP